MYIYKHKTAGADTGTGQRGPWPRPLAKLAPSNRIKVPQVGHILRRKWPSRGTYCGKSAPTGVNFAQIVPHVAKFIHTFCPTFSLGPSPFKILYLPLKP